MNNYTWYRVFSFRHFGWIWRRPYYPDPYNLKWEWEYSKTKPKERVKNDN